MFPLQKREQYSQWSHSIQWDGNSHLSIQYDLQQGWFGASTRTNMGTGPTLPILMLQSLRSAKIPPFEGKRTENISVWLKTIPTKLQQIDYPKELWNSKVALHLTGSAALFVGTWFEANPDDKNNWVRFQEALIVELAIKDTNVMIARKLKNTPKLALLRSM